MIKKILMLCIPLAMVCFASCIKDNEDNSQSNGDYPLYGTTWQCVEDEDTWTISFGTTECTMVMAHGLNEQQAIGSYTYRGTVTSGQGTIRLRNDEGTFTISGQELSLSSENITRFFTLFTD